MSHTIAEEITFGDRGRVVLPSAVRSELGWVPGTRLLVTTEPDGSLRMRPYRAVAESLRGLLADVAPGEPLVDELLAERRAEAARE
ncbi:MAG: AbrB/MazE/SpoVT family DNA-binding domain-containing protein [Solirubrobacteraceae bacterium]